MTPERIRDALGGSVVCTSAYDTVTADVPLADWVPVVTTARDALRLTLFDLLTAIDEQAAGFDVVVRLWSPTERVGLLLRTRCPREAPVVPSLSEVFAGAAWHEREVAEMFGITFDGHPGLSPLLLPEGFQGYPMRKEFVLASRVGKAWPGAKDPGESDADLATGRPRRRHLPPGVPKPGTWP